MKKLLSIVLSMVIVTTMFVGLFNKTANADATTDVTNFVTRLYNVCLDRSPDSSGLNDWTSQLINKKATGVSVAYGFIYSQEFQNKNCSNSDFVTYMYSAFFGREPDTAGFNDWVNRLGTGYTREDVFQGFANSQEFYNLCQSFGVVRGDYFKGRDVRQVAKVSLFVERLYNVIFDRSGDMNGMTDWTTRLVTGAQTGSEVAYGFLWSQEYSNKHKSNPDFVEDLYKALMGRASDAQGKANWLNQLNTGSAKEAVFNGFVGSVEFTNICNDYGITRGDGVAVPPVTPPQPCGSAITVTRSNYANLVENDDCYLRIEYYNNQLIVEKFSKDLTFINTTTIPQSKYYPTGCTDSEFVFGKLYAGENYIYLLTGAKNLSESTTKKTIRVSKFDRDMNFISCCEVSKENSVEIYQPFAWTTTDMIEFDGKLWISFGRTGFGEIHHQGKQNMIIDISNMNYIAGTYNFWHSFGQFFDTCNGELFEAEISDGQRSVFVENQVQSQYLDNWGSAYAGSTRYGTVKQFWRTSAYGMWSYATYWGLDGMQASNTKNTLITYGTGYNVDFEAMTEATQGLTSDQISSVTYNYTSGKTYDLWIGITNASDLDSSTVKFVPGGEDAYNVVMLKINENKFILMWNTNRYSNTPDLHYLYIDGNGNFLTGVQTVQASLFYGSSPIVTESGDIIWYYTRNTAPTFNRLSSDGTLTVTQIW